MLVGTQEPGDNAVYLFSQLPVLGWQQRAKIVADKDERLVGQSSIAEADQHIVIAGLVTNKEDARKLTSKLYILDIQSSQ